MTNIKNDAKILELKKKIEEKKNELGNGRFTPITNCNLEWMDKRYNIHTQNLSQLQFLLVELSLRKKMAEKLDINLEVDYFLSGYSLNDWITDIKSKLVNLNRKDEERKLKIMESKLDKLLSNEKKVELELKEIEGLL